MIRVAGRRRTVGMTAIPVSPSSGSLTRAGYRALHPAMIDRLCRLGRGLSPDQWTAPSLCEGWRVCDVFGHMTYGGITPLWRVAPTLLFGYRGNINRGSAVVSRRYADEHPQAELMDVFERSSHHPVGIGRLIKPDELFVDHVIHELDVCRPLGIDSELTGPELRAALDGAVRLSNPLFAPARAARGKRLEATDLGWSHGDPGDPVTRDTAQNLLLLLGGRS